MEASHGGDRQRRVQADNTTKEATKLLPSHSNGQGIDVWPEQEPSTLTATLPTSGISFPQSNNTEDPAETETGYHASYTGRLIRETPLYSVGETGGDDRGTEQVCDVALDERKLTLQPPQQHSPIGLSRSSQTQGPGLSDERKPPPEPTRRHAPVGSPLDDRKPPYIDNHHSTGRQQQTGQIQDLTSVDNRKPPPQQYLPQQRQKSSSPERAHISDSNYGTPRSRIRSLNEIGHNTVEEVYFQPIPSERMYEDAIGSRDHRRIKGMELEPTEDLCDVQNTIRQDPDHRSWPRSSEVFGSPLGDPRLQGTSNKVNSQLRCRSRLGLELESPRGLMGFAERPTDPSQPDDQHLIHQHNQLHSLQSENLGPLYRKQNVPIQPETTTPNYAPLLNRDFSSNDGTARSVTCTSSTATEQTCHQGRDFGPRMPQRSLPADWCPGALYPNQRSPQHDYARSLEMFDVPSAFPPQCKGRQREHSSRASVEDESSFLMKTPAGSLIVSQLDHHLRSHSLIEQFDSPHRPPQHTSQSTDTKFISDVERPLPPPPTRIPLGLETDRVQNTEVEGIPKQTQEAPVEAFSVQRPANAQTYPADTHLDPEIIQNTEDVPRRCATCSSVPNAASNYSDRSASPEIPDRSIYPTEPTRVELDAVLSECISYQEYASGVIDDRQIIDEAIDACRIEREVVRAIRTGQFPSLRELKESKEQLSTRMRNMSFEERRNHVLALDEYTAMIKRETEKRLSMHPQQENTPSCAQPETPSVFLSYTGQDDIAAMFASSLSVALDSLKISNFFDASTLQYGEPWKKEIERSVSGCVVFVCILSPMFPFRKWCMHELDLAIRSNKKVLPVCVGSEFYEHTEEFRASFYNVHRKKGILDTTIGRWEQNVLDLSDIHAVRNYLVCRKTAYERMKGSVVAAIQRMLKQVPEVPDAPARESKRLSRLSKEISRRLRVFWMHNSPTHTSADEGDGSGDHDTSGSSSDDNSDNMGDDQDRTRNQMDKGRSLRNFGTGSGTKSTGADTSKPQQRTKERGIDHGNLEECSEQLENSEDSAAFSSKFGQRIEAPSGNLGIVAMDTLNGLKVQRVESGSPLEDKLFPGDLITKIGDVALCRLKAENPEHMLTKPSATPRTLTVMRVDGRRKHRGNASKTNTTGLPPLPEHKSSGTMAIDRPESRNRTDVNVQGDAYKGLRYKDQVLPVVPPLQHGGYDTSDLTVQHERRDETDDVSMVPACGLIRKFQAEAEPPEAPLAVGVLVAGHSQLDPPTANHPSDIPPLPILDVSLGSEILPTVDIAPQRPRRIKTVWKQLRGFFKPR